MYRYLRRQRVCIAIFSIAFFSILFLFLFWQKISWYAEKGINIAQILDALCIQHRKETHSANYAKGACLEILLEYLHNDLSMAAYDQKRLVNANHKALYEQDLWKGSLPPLTAGRCSNSDIILAFVILLHQPDKPSNKGANDIRIVLELLKVLQSPSHYIIIHVAKAEYSSQYMRTLKSSAQKLNQTFIAPFSLHCEWGGRGIVLANILSINELFKRDICFDFVINLSGADFLIKPLHILHSTLTSLLGRNMISVTKQTSLSEQPFVLSDCNIFPVVVTKCAKGVFIPEGIADQKWRHHQFEKLISGNFSIFRGSQWNILHREFSYYVVNDPSIRAWWFGVFYYSWVPDECFFQTIIKHSKFAHTLVNDNYRLIGPKHLGRHIGEEMLPNISSSSALFARKFFSFTFVELLQQKLIRI